jgi:hypothetical protein
MFSLNDIIQQAQGGAGIDNLAQQFGISPQQAQNAVNVLLPALSAGLQTRTQEPSGLADLFGAMFNERHQEAFDNPATLNSAETAADGQDAINRLFGSEQATQALAAHAAQTTGLSAGLLQSMIPMVVSMLMGGMFKGMQGSGLGGMLEQLGRAGANSPGNSSGGLGDLLGQVLGGALGGGGASQQQAPQPAPQERASGGGLGDLLGGLFGGGRQPPQQTGGGADQIFPQGFDPSSLQAGLDTLGKMLNPGGSSPPGAQQQPGLQDILGQILGGGRR